MNQKSQSRSAARLAAVQALYQHTMEEIPIPQLLHEFHTHRLGEEIDEDQFADADVDFFDDVVQGTTARIAEIDGLIEGKLASGWSLTRLDRTLHQILRAGTYELLARRDVPVGSVINEYLDVAHAFFDAKDTRFANGLLDAIAKDVRA